MSKRFTQTEIWEEDWFLEMPEEYMLFWFFIKDKCNHAGIWRPNIRYFNNMIKSRVNLDRAIELFNKEKKRVKILDSGHWFIIDFFRFQYGTSFNLRNRLHKSIQNIYTQENITLTSIRGLEDLKNEITNNPQNTAHKSIEDIHTQENINLTSTRPQRDLKHGPNSKKDNILHILPQKGKNSSKEKNPDEELIKNLNIKSSFHGVFLSWLRYKRKRGQSYKDKDSTFLAYKKLFKLSDGDASKAKEVVEQSMANNWAGLFSLNEDKQQYSPKYPKYKYDGDIRFTLDKNGVYRDNQGRPF